VPERSPIGSPLTNHEEREGKKRKAPTRDDRGRYRFDAGTTYAGRNCNLRYLVVEAECRYRGRQVMFALRRHDRSTDGEELDHVRAPAVRAFLQLHADDAFGL